MPDPTPVTLTVDPVERMAPEDIAKIRTSAERRVRVCRACHGHGWTWEACPQQVIGDEEYRKDCPHCDARGVIAHPDAFTMRLCDAVVAAESRAERAEGLLKEARRYVAHPYSVISMTGATERDMLTARIDAHLSAESTKGPSK